MKISMKEQTVFSTVFGDSPYIKVLDFFLDNDVYDYSKSDIAREAGISRITLESILSDLLSLGVVKQTRINGKAKMYQLSKDSELVKKLLAFDLEISTIGLKIPLEAVISH